MHLGSKAVSPLIATVLVTLFGVITLGIALGVVNPTFRRAQDTSAVNDQFQTLQTLNAAVKEVASEPDGSRRIVPITITAGTLRVNSTYDWLYFEYEPSEAMDISGEKGDIRVEHGLEFADYFNYYADGSRATPTWTNTSGQWVVSGGAYSGTNGTSYHNVSGPLENWKFSATITNVSGTTGGEVFALPTNPESLLGYWPMDEGAGSKVYDYSGNNNTGTLTNMNNTGDNWNYTANAPSGWTSGKFDSGLGFDGGDDYVTFGDVNKFDGLSAITISVWLYPREGDDGIASDDSFLMRYSGWASFYLSNSTGHGSGYLGQTASLNNWHHFIGTYDSNAAGNNMKLYVDGELSSEQQFSGALRSAGGSFTLSVSAGSADRFNGTLDEVMVFNRSLTQGEITALYETSTKKLLATGTQTITTKTNVSIVLSNPAGKTSFDDVTVTREKNKLTLLVPYTNVELNGTLRLTKGEHKIQIKHMETNTTTSRPIVELTAV